jgi:hypothetical protein
MIREYMAQLDQVPTGGGFAARHCEWCIDKACIALIMIRAVITNEAHTLFWFLVLTHASNDFLGRLKHEGLQFWAAQVQPAGSDCSERTPWSS